MAGSKPGRRRKGEPPSMRPITIRGKEWAYVHLEGQRHYLGRWGTQEARQRFREVIARWEAASRPSATWRPAGPLITVADLAAAHHLHAQVYYRRQDGSRTEEVGAYRQSMAPLVATHPGKPVNEVTKADLRAVLDRWVAADLARATINQRLGRIKRVFRWGVREDLVEESTADRLDHVANLPKGRSLARETDEVQPAPFGDVMAAFFELSPHDRLKILVQLRCGARPGEVCRMRRDEVHVGEVRIGKRTLPVPAGCRAFVPGQHKTGWRGKVVAYVLGPRLVSLLLPWMADVEGDYLFPGALTRPYELETDYCRRVTAACDRAGVDRWSPNRLRHCYLTRRDRQAGIELASASVGHSRISTTEIYVQRDMERAATVAAKWD